MAATQDGATLLLEMLDGFRARVSQGDVGEPLGQLTRRGANLRAYRLGDKLAELLHDDDDAIDAALESSKAASDAILRWAMS
jgi:hypothetical protein